MDRKQYKSLGARRGIVTFELPLPSEIQAPTRKARIELDDYKSGDIMRKPQR